MVQTMAFQAKLLSHYMFQSQSMAMKLSKMLIKPALQKNHLT